MSTSSESDTEAHRHRCEVAFVCDLPTIDRRRDYLNAIDKRRGAEAGARLRRDVRTEWKRRQQAGGAPSPQGGYQAQQGGAAVHLGEPEVRPASVPAAGSFPPGWHEGPLRRDGCVDSGVSA